MNGRLSGLFSRHLRRRIRQNVTVQLEISLLGNEVVVSLRPVRWPVERRRRIPDDLEHRPRWMHVSERSRAVSKLDGGDADGPDVGSVPVDLVVPARRGAAEHLRRHVARRSDARAAFAQSAAGGRRQAKVAQLHFPLGREQYVAALDVAVDEVVLVQVHQRRHRLAQDVRDVLLGRATIDGVQPRDEVGCRAPIAILSESYGHVNLRFSRGRQADTNLQHEPDFLGSRRGLLPVGAIESQQVRMLREVAQNAVFLVDDALALGVVALDFDGDVFVRLAVEALHDLIPSDWSDWFSVSLSLRAI